MGGISLDIGGLADSVFDFSGNQARADKQIAAQETWNRATFGLDQEKFWDSQDRYRKEYDYRQNQFQNLVRDANKAGISISTALGASGSSPISTSIPGHSGKTVAGNSYAKNYSGKAMMDMDVIGQSQKTLMYNQALEQQFQADLAYWNSKQAELDYNLSTGSPYPKKYQLYDDNIDEARKWIKNGGFVVPHGASMELPESIGAYHFGKPYVTPEDLKQDLSDNPNRYKIGVMP